MADRLLIADVGGTFTRVRLMAGLDCEFERKASISSIDELLIFLRQFLGSSGPARRAVLAVAGAVISPERAHLTNWAGVPEITSQHLVDAGLAEHVTLLNDLESAAMGLAADLTRSGSEQPPEGCERLNDACTSPGHFILVAPGTGLGAAAGVAAEKGTAGLSFKVLPIEAQHTAIPCPREQWAGLWHDLDRDLGRPASWEEVVSGRGLERVFSLLGGQAGLTAGQVADQARSNPIARQALTVYYLCAIKFCQLLALTIRPHRGVFLGGASTISNRAFLGTLELGDWFVDNPARGHELKQLPIFLDPRSRVLDGAVIMARYQLAL